MNFEEFLTPKHDDAETVQSAEPVNEEIDSGEDNLDVQKAVVESLAADNAAQVEELREARDELAAKEGQVKEYESTIDSLRRENKALTDDISLLKTIISDLECRLAAEQDRKIDMQERNPNALALLDRDVELPDRFPGESRDHVLEVLREARDAAERGGRLRRAQILEAVLVANEPNGTLATKRAELEKLFSDNGNIVSGPVLEELSRQGISHKNGEEYLLPSEIIRRTY